VIVAGERRFRAAQLAGLPSLQCIEATAELTPSVILLEQLTENCVRQDLKPVEQAYAYQTLMNSEGWGVRELADHLHVHPGTVSKALTLLSLPEPVRDKVDAGRISASAGYDISRIKDPEKQAEAVEAAEAKGGRKARASAREEAASRPRKMTYRVDGGATVLVTHPDPHAGPDQIEAALDQALKACRRERRGRGAA
jgi:ParB family chromosome partitioning protein